jgi:nitroreductase
MNMKTKTSLLLIVLVLFNFQLTRGQSAGNAVTDLLLSAYSPRNFTAEPVTDQQIDLILKCGIKAPSGRNQQPWRFTVVRDEPSMKDIIGNAVAGNILILVSGPETQERGTPDLDCGLATQNMFIAATSLGLGARIYGGPTAAANAKRETLQVPAGFKVIMILRVGNIDKSVDAVSGASARKPQEEIVNYKK